MEMVYLTCLLSTAVGIRCKDGVVFAVEKLVQSKLYEPGANKRYFTIDRHIGMVSILGQYVSIVLCHNIL